MAMAKQRVTLEVLSYHATAPLEEAIRLRVSDMTNSFMFTFTGRTYFPQSPHGYFCCCGELER